MSEPRAKRQPKEPSRFRDDEFESPGKRHAEPEPVEESPRSKSTKRTTEPTSTPASSHGRSSRLAKELFVESPLPAPQEKHSSKRNATSPPESTPEAPKRSSKKSEQPIDELETPESKPRSKTPRLQDDAPKKEKQTTKLSPLQEIITDIMNTLDNLRDKEGYDVIYPFRKLPTKRELPSYYEEIEDPIDMAMINSKIKSNHYENLDQFSLDIELMVKNARKFNMRNTPIHDTATRIARTARAKIANAKHAELAVQFSSILLSLRAITDKRGRVISEIFEVLPTRDELPSYYEMVPQPIDLESIQKRIESSRYPATSDFFKDLVLVFDNAMFFNANGSVIFKDASKLKDFVLLQAKALDVEVPQTPALEIPKSNSKFATKMRRESILELEDEDSSSDVQVLTPVAKHRSKARESNQEQDPIPKVIVKVSHVKPEIPKLVIKTSELAKEEAPTISTETVPKFRSRLLPQEDGIEDYSKDPRKLVLMRDVLDRIINFVEKEDGHFPAEAFKVCPPKEEFPDYYQLITSPISLEEIQAKLDKDEYPLFEDLLRDLDLMYDNALKYNAERSQIYKDAVKERRNSRYRVRIALEKMKTPATPGEPLPKRESAVRARAITEMNSIAREHEATQGIDQAFHSSLRSVLSAVLNHKDEESGLLIAEPFMELPSEEDYPDYYIVIKKPIDLKKIQSNIRNKVYSTMADLVKDFALIFTNAMTYNEEGSDIYNDAITLLRIARKAAKANSNEEIEAVGTLQAVDADNSVYPAGEITRPFKSAHDLVPDPLQNQFQTILDGVINYQGKDGKFVSMPFIHLLSPKDHPEYYKIIRQPIDLQTIQNRIDQGVYRTMQAFMMDLRLLWHNAAVFYERGSRVQLDSDKLRRHGLKLMRSLTGYAEGEEDTPSSSGSYSGNPAQSTTPIVETVPFPSLMVSSGSNCSARDKSLIMQYLQIFDYLKNFRSQSNRRLCDILIRIPNAIEFPNYHRLIVSPIDIATIISRVKANSYRKVIQFVMSMVSLFENALLFYRGHLAHFTDVTTVYQLFKVKMRNDFPPTAIIGLFWLEKEAKIVWQICLSTVNTLLLEIDPSKKLYYLNDIIIAAHSGSDLRLIREQVIANAFLTIEEFQNKVLSLLRQVRENVTINSEVFQASRTLQKRFVDELHRLCDQMNVTSVALNYTSVAFELEISEEISRNTKEEVSSVCNVDPPADTVTQENKDEATSAEVLQVPEEHPPEDEETGRDDVEADTQTNMHLTELSSILFNEIEYHVGEFVYMSNSETPSLPHVVLVSKILKDDNTESVKVAAVVFYRPSETWHVATRLFFDQEVFLSPEVRMFSSSLLLGKCYVSSFREYLKLYPRDLSPEDHYLCESRYLAKSKSIQRAKVFPKPGYETPLVSREVPLEYKSLKRVKSVFAESILDQEPTSALQLDVDQNPMQSTDLNADNIVVDSRSIMSQTQAGDKETFYDRFYIGTFAYTVGDGLFVALERVVEETAVYQIKSISMTSNNVLIIRGVKFYFPPRVEGRDLSGLIDRPFFTKELIMSENTDIIPLDCILGKCCILHYSEYSVLQPIGYSKEDTFFFHYQVTTRRIDTVSIDSVSPRPASLAPLEICSYTFPQPFAELPPQVHSEWDRREFERKVRIHEEINRQNQLEAEMLQKQAQALAGKQLSLESRSSAMKKFGTISSSPQSTPLLAQSGRELFIRSYSQALVKKRPWLHQEQQTRESQQMWDQMAAETKSAWEERFSEYIAVHQRNLAQLQPIELLCKWGECKATFESPDDLQGHVMLVHVTHDPSNEYACNWKDCNEEALGSRAKLARHYNDKHKISVHRRASVGAPKHSTPSIPFPNQSSSPVKPSPASAKAIPGKPVVPTHSAEAASPQTQVEEPVLSRKYQVQFSSLFLQHLSKLALASKDICDAHLSEVPSQSSKMGEDVLAGLEFYAETLLETAHKF